MKKLVNNKRVLCIVALVLVFSVCFATAVKVSKADRLSDEYRRGRNSRRSITLSEEEYKLFVCIVYCEAGGENYDCQLGVANVILNRIKMDGWPNTLKEVVYQKHQFSPVTNGYLNKSLREYAQGKFNTKWHESCFKAVDDALAGKNNIGNRQYFMTAEALKRVLGNNYYDRKDIGKTAFFNTNW